MILSIRVLFLSISVVASTEGSPQTSGGRAEAGSALLEHHILPLPCGRLGGPEDCRRPPGKPALPLAFLHVHSPGVGPDNAPPTLGALCLAWFIFNLFQLKILYAM